MRYTFFGPTGQELDVAVPLPGRHQPKSGHWRTKPLGHHKMKPRGGAHPHNPANVQGIGTEFRSKRRRTRKELRALIAAGVLPPSAMPSRGGR